MLADLAPHIFRLPSDMIINKYYYHVSKHSMLVSIPIIISYLISTEEDDLGIFC